MKTDHIYTMFLHEDFFKTFTDRPVANGQTTQTLLAIGVKSRSEVDEMVKTAVESGGFEYSEPRDHGWMYQWAFADPDGHQWEVMHGDVSQISSE